MLGLAKRWRAILEAVLVVALVWGAVHVGRSWLEIRAAADHLRTAPVGGVEIPGTVLGSVAGIDLAGAVVAPSAAQVHRVLVFLVRPASAAADLGFWRDVSARFGDQPMVFEGYCEAAACAAAQPRLPNLILLQAGAVRVTAAVVRADQAGDAVLIATAGRAKIVANIRWRTASTPARVAGVIAGMR